MRQTPVYIVCSPQPRVGVTSAARLLGDYFLSKQRPFAGFDTDAHETPFANCFPQHARVVNLTAIQGQISLFDRLLVHDDVPKIVDVWNRSFRPFFSIIRDTGFFEEARRLSVEPVLLFVADAGNECLEAARQIHQQWPDVSMIAVNNEGAAPLGYAAHDILAKFPAQSTFQIPALDPLVQREIERPGFSISRFLLAPPSEMSIVVRTALRAWIARVFAQFQSYELREALNQTRILS